MVAQDITRYGVDLYGSATPELSGGFAKLRHTLDTPSLPLPRQIDDGLISVIAEDPRLNTLTYHTAHKQRNPQKNEPPGTGDEIPVF